MDPLKRHPRSAIHRPGPARKLDANNVASARKRRRQGPTPLLKPCSVGAREWCACGGEGQHGVSGCAPSGRAEQGTGMLQSGLYRQGIIGCNLGCIGLYRQGVIGCNLGCIGRGNRCHRMDSDAQGLLRHSRAARAIGGRAGWQSADARGVSACDWAHPFSHAMRDN